MVTRSLVTQRRALRASAIVIVLSCSVGLVTSCDPRTEFLANAYLVNQSRAASGLSHLGWNAELAAKATAWAQHLASIGRLEHSNLADGVSPGWRALGENVGVADDVPSVHSAFLRSTEHRRNMLNPGWRVMGIGTARSGNRVFVVEVYMS